MMAFITPTFANPETTRPAHVASAQLLLPWADKGLITVDESGTIVPSPALSQVSLQVLGLDKDTPIVHLRARHQSYMQWHREHVFQK